MSKKFKQLTIIYVSAALIVLSLYTAVTAGYLRNLRRYAETGGGSGFEASIYAVDNLSTALEKSRYAASDGMCSTVCAEIYANALAAEATLTALPFNTVQLQKLQAFLNVTGDYAYTLCALGSFSDEARQELLKLSEAAKGYEAALIDMRAQLSSGELQIDSRENRLRNIPDEDDTRYLSAAVLDYENGLEPLEEPSYDGQYGAQPSRLKAELSEADAMAAAEEYLDEPELSLKYNNGLRMYTDGERSVTVGENGVTELRSRRLVAETLISEKEAQEAAESFLKDRGYEASELSEAWTEGNVAVFVYNRCSEDVSLLCSRLTVSVALDDGSIYAFDANEYELSENELSWLVDEEEAKEALPEGIEAIQTRRTAIKTAGGKIVACYELECEGARVYVNAETGGQQSIVLYSNA